MATLKQKIGVQKTLENSRMGNPKTQGEILVESGYSLVTSTTPSVITNSKGWQELMEKYLPDELLAKKHKELLNVPIKVKQFRKGELMTQIEQTDAFAISKGLELAYKVKKKFPKENDLGGQTNNFIQIVINPPNARKDT